MSKNYDELRINFREIRKKAKLKVKDLSDKSNGVFSTKSIERFENGHTTLDFIKVEQLYALLGMRIDMASTMDHTAYDRFFNEEVMEYKGYKTSYRYSGEDKCYVGSIDGIDSVVSFDGNDLVELRAAFEDAVEYYIDFCQRKGIKE